MQLPSDGHVRVAPCTSSASRTVPALDTSLAGTATDWMMMRDMEVHYHYLMKLDDVAVLNVAKEKFTQAVVELDFF